MIPVMVRSTCSRRAARFRCGFPGDRVGPLLIVEGTRQFLATLTALDEADHQVVGMAGCWGWSRDRMPSTDFHALHLDDREVFLAFDADITTNIDVWTAASRLRDAAKVAGTTRVAFIKIPASDKVGLDDYLAAVPIEKRTTNVLGLIATAKSALPARPKPPATVAGEPAPEQDPGSPPGYEQEDGDAILDDMVGFVGRFVVMPSDHHLAAVALWIAHTHFIDILDDSPRLSIRSAEKRSGKTRLLELVAGLARRARMTSSMSTSYLFRSVESSTPTLLIDEADTIFGKKRGSLLRGVAGSHQRRVPSRSEGRPDRR